MEIELLPTFPELVDLFLKDFEPIKCKYKKLTVSNYFQNKTCEPKIVLCSKISCLKNYKNNIFSDYLESLLGRIYYFDNEMIDHNGKRFIFDSELFNGFEYDNWLDKMRSASTLKNRYFKNVLYLMPYFGKLTRCNVETW